MSREAFSQLIAGYAKKLGLNEIPIQDDFRVCLTFEPEINLDIQWNDQDTKLYLYSPCTKLITTSNAELAFELLSAIHFWKDTAGATLSLESETNTIYLCDKNTLETFTSIGHFSDHVDVFLDTVLYWRDRIRELNQFSKRNKPSSPKEKNATEQDRFFKKLRTQDVRA